MADPQVICGGGCGDTYIADYIREKVRERGKGVRCDSSLLLLLLGWRMSTR